MFVCLFHHGSTRMARQRAFCLAVFTLSLLRPACGKSFMTRGGDRVHEESLARSGSVRGRGRSADVFIFADGQRHYEDPVCPSDCLKCSISGECLQCTNSKYLDPVKASCKDICPDGYFPGGTGISNRTCTPCAMDCAVCLSREECVQCTNNKYLSPTGSCESSCPPGHYDYGENGGTCRSCPPTCQTCSDWNACDVCEPGAYLSPNRSCSVVCDDGYYKSDTNTTPETGGLCAKCDETCSKCISRNVCTECRKKMYLSQVDNMCGPSCAKGFYKQGKDDLGNTCEECPDSCLTCTSSTKCSSCKDGYFLTPNATCAPTCPEGHFANSTRKRCLSCPEGCGTCTAGLVSPVVCLECSDYKYLSPKGECVRTCPEGYYAEGYSGPYGGQCILCDLACTACNSKTECTKCRMLHYLTAESTCQLLECPRGFYEQGGLDLKEPGVCLSCAENCAECDSLQGCTVCKNNHYLHQGHCFPSCPTRYYGVEVADSNNPEGRLCRNCRFHDYECTSPNALVGQAPDPALTIVATSCQNDYYLYDGACHPKDFCPMGTYPRRGEELEDATVVGNFVGGNCSECPQNCLSCSSPSRCTTCKGGTYLTAEMSCEEACPPQYFGIGTADTGRTCQPCANNCLECQSQQFCTRCTNGTLLTDGFTCEAKCPDGYYPRNPADGSLDGRTCQKCVGDCLTCDTRFSCTKCKNSAYLTHKKECQRECPASHYPDGSKASEGRYCVECPGMCSECKGPHYCTQCKTPTFLTAHGTCDASCQEGYWQEVGREVHTFWGMKVGGVCKSCPQNCDRCVGSGCIECNKFQYLDAEGQCVSRCPDGYFGIGVEELGRVCAPCSDAHGDCLNRTFVLQCGENLYLDPWNNTCIQTCPVGYFGLDGEIKEGGRPRIGGTCERCLGSCKICSSATTCQVCTDGMYLNPLTDRCTMECPKYHYMVGNGTDGRSCKACPFGASKCVNETWVYECRGNNQYLVPEGGKCTTKCPQGYFEKSGVQVEEDAPLVGGTCEKCVGSCHHCKSESECLECNGGLYLDPTTSLCTLECPRDHFMTGMGDKGRACTPCPDNFAVCRNASYAVECRGDQQYMVPEGGRCAPSCLDGYFARSGVELEVGGPLVGGTCERCVAPCETCISTTECKICKGGTYLNPYDMSCSFDCPSGSYMTGTGDVGRKCELCPAEMQSCTNNTYATLCKGDSYYLTPKHSCELNCPDGYFKMGGFPVYEGGPMVGGTCQKCVNNCKNCYTESKCTSCRNGAYFNPRSEQCDFSCPEDHYMVGKAEEGRVCAACPEDFHTCLNDTYGTHCRGDNKYLTDKGTCISTCPDGYFRRASDIVGVDGVLIGGSCEKCVGDCKECLKEKECAVCENGKYLKNGTCLTACPTGFFQKDGKDGINGTCELCKLGAASCKAGTQDGVTIALACEPGFELKDSECVNSCASGKYKNLTTDKCVDCPATCVECLNATKCSLCKNGESLDLSELPSASKCVDSCPDGFFSEKGLCMSCSKSCSKCDSGTSCKECKDYRYLNPAKTCEDDCPKGYYGTGINATGRSCKACSKNCLSCASSGECRECGSQKYLVPEGWCEDGCPKGYYAKGNGDTGRTCEACPGDFFNCVNQKLGTECKNRKYLTSTGTCENGCPMGTYPHGTGDLGRMCMPCGPNCAVCTTGDTCDKCTNSFYLSPDFWCEDSCPGGYYKSGTGKLNRSCALCPMDALKCISPTVATECRDAKYLTAAGSCEYLCPEGTYPAGHSTIGRTCEVCDVNCASCKKANICTKCKNRRYLTSDMWCEEECPDGYYRNGTGKVGRNCVRCPGNAMKCIGPALITECKDWQYLTPDGTCADNCPEGTYPAGVNQVGRVCEVCDKDCVTCTKENKCEKCRNGKYLTPSGWCEAACPHGTYKNGVGAIGNTCDPCPGDASGCITPKYATECKNSKFLTADASCQETCPVGYFPEGTGEVGKVCPRCQEHCYSCQSSALCTVCDNKRVLSPNMSCVDDCPDGYFRNASEKIGNNCTECTKHANKCLNLTHITECKNARYLNPDFTCQVDCPRGLYQLGDEDTGRVCTGCPSNCTLCVNATTCTECRNNNYLGPDFLCQQECPSDHYYAPAESLTQIDWKQLQDRSCGGTELRRWSGGTDARYGEGFVENVEGCKLLCMARAECTGFELREESNRCSYWMGDTLSPSPAKGIHCYSKVGLVPVKKNAAAGEVVIPAPGIASMSSNLNTAPAKLCNDGLISTRCSSTWNNGAGELNPWWQMDLGSKESLVKIRILSDPDGCEALSEEATGLHCSLLGGVVGVSSTPCEKGKLCKGTVCGTLTEATAEKWYEVTCDRAEGRYVYLQLKGYRVLNFYELVAYKVSETESCTETWQLTNVKQKGHTFTAANQEGGSAFAVAGPVSSIAFMPGQDDQPLWVGLTTDPTDERDFPNGKFIQLTAGSSVAIDGAFEGLTYTREDYFRLELKGGEMLIYKNGAPLHSFKLDASGSLNGFYAMMWFPETKPDEPAVYVSRVQTTCFPLQEGVGGKCMKCPNDASRCVNESIALECKNEMFLQLTHVCEAECPEGQFETDGPNGVGGYCSLCHENCKTCMNATTCLECKNQHYLTHDFKCAPECPRGYYGVKSDDWDDGLGGRCKACHENCSACNSWEECTECRLYTFRTPSATCSDECPDAYYKNGTEKVGGECLPCADNCFQCVSGSTCAVCNSSYFLALSGACVEHCPDGEYEVGDEDLGRECKKCPSGFNRCISAKMASECNNHLYLTAGAQCETTCPDGFYRSPINGKPIGRECPRCPEDCNKCEDAGACSECKNNKFLNPDLWCETECPTGWYKVGNKEIGNTCEKCPEHCRSCLDSETCTECMDFKYLAPSRQCVETCPINTFHLGDGEAGRVCAYCEKGCHSCSTSTRCLECNSSLHLDEAFNCVEACPDGFYPEGDEDRGRSCLSCPTYCSVCTGPDICLECNVFRYLNPDSSCRADCPDGFYRTGHNETGGTCPRCFHTCNRCDSADVCTECKNFTYLTPDSKCNYECPAGYWERGTEEIGGTCELCSDNCMECSSAEVCEVCQNGYFLDISSSTCKKECPDGFWGKIPDPKVETGRICELCSWPCNKCDSAQICTECKDSSYLTPYDTCEYTCPPGFYPHGIGEINVTCQPCSENCATCDTFEVCTTCKNEKYLIPDGSCQDNCPDGYWELPAAGGVGNACPLCAENCSLCTSATVCQECRNSTYLTHYNWCEPICQDGWYHKGAGDIGRNCEVCPWTCNKCEAEDYCTECKISLYLTSQHSCEKTCPVGFYPNRSREVGGECETCPEQCTQCTSASTCSECKDGLFLTPDSFCEESCPTGHYAQVGNALGVGGTCPMCPENCFACNSAEECTVCRHFTHLTEYGQCRSECPAGYYENGTSNVGGNCNKCPSPCNLCETGTVCTECAEASYLTPTGSCSYKCPDGYHYEGSQEIGRFCKVCPPTCQTCLGQGQCTLCQNYTYLTPNQTCEYTCPDGTYRGGIQETGNTCPACPGDMERCINTTYATECKHKRYLTPAAKCEEGCPDGFFKLGRGEVGRSCPRCAQNCTLCTNATTCHECQNGQYLTHTNWCDHECPDGYYKFGEGDVGRICKVCKAPCNTCLGPDLCTECKQGMFLTPKGTCEMSCPDGYWASPGTNGIGGTCAICPENCEECGAETMCTVCTNNTYLHARECKARCPDGWFHLGEEISNRECVSCKPGCSQCSNETFCSECKNGLFLSASGQCESTCPEGFFNLPGTDGVGGVCQLCAENCTKCEWWDRCLECKSSKYLTHYNWCTEGCPAGYFKDGEGEVGRVCVECPENCNTCEDSLICTECKNATYLTPAKQCDSECPNGFFQEGFRNVGRTCQACSENCNQCLSATECLECRHNAYLTTNEDCAASCPKGYYGQGEQSVGNTCQKCSKDCEECDGIELCTKCTNSTFLTENKFCTGECTTGFIQTGDTVSGRVCEELCFWCG